MRNENKEEWKPSEIAMTLSSIKIDLERELFKSFKDSERLMKDVPTTLSQKDDVIKQAIINALKRAFPNSNLKEMK